ncbi:MAG TPA: hypothetical protein VGL20_03490 [Candidatus Dormibacteraeota bacterium]
MKHPDHHCSTCGRPFGRVESHLCRDHDSGRLVWRVSTPEAVRSLER